MMNYLQELFKKQSVDSVVSNLEELSNYSAPYFPGRSTVSILPTKQILIEEEIYSQIISIITSINITFTWPVRPRSLQYLCSPPPPMLVTNTINWWPKWNLFLFYLWVPTQCLDLITEVQWSSSLSFGHRPTQMLYMRSGLQSVMGGRCWSRSRSRSRDSPLRYCHLCSELNSLEMINQQQLRLLCVCWVHVYAHLK